MMSVGLSTMPTMSLDTVSSPEPLRTDDVAPTGQSDDAAWSSIHGDAEYRWHLLHHDLQKLAGWMAIRGRESQPLVCMELEDSAPEELQELAARVNDFRFDDLLDPAAHRADPLDEVVEFVRGCDEREVAILRDRFVGWDRRTLDEIGAEFGVTRERIRQVEKQLLARFREVTDSSTAVSRLLASMRIDIDPVCRLDRLAAKNPVLEQRVPRLDVPLWRVLDQLDDAFVVDDGWAAMPSIEAAKARTRTLFDEVADEHGVALSEDFATVTELQAQERDAWMRYCEFRAEGQHLFAPLRSVTDLAVQILSAAGEPLAFDDLFSRMAVDRNPRGIRDRFGQDDRIARVARGTYGLAEWGGDEYVSIRDMIAQRVDENGAYPLQDLIDEITPRGVAASSVRSYAAYGRFEIRNGMVTRRDEPGAPVRPPEESPGLYRVDDGWALLVELNHDHLRGSGFAVPSGVAALTGLAWGAERLLASAVGHQAVRFRSSQPTLGTIRRLVEHHGGQEGDRALLVFTDDGRFEYRQAAPVAADAAPLHRAVSLIGHAPVGTDEDAMAVLAAAVGMPGEDRPRRILSAYRRRHENMIIEMLENAWL